VTDLNPYVIGSIRFFAAFLILFPIVYIKEGRNAFPHWKDLPILVFQGFIGVFLYNIFYLKGLSLTTVMNGSLISASIPVVTAVISILYLGERLNKIQISGFMVSLIGVVIIISRGSLQVLRQMQFSSGDVLILLSVICWSVYSIGGKIAMKRFTPLAYSAYSCGLGAVMLTFWSWPHFRIAELVSMSWQALGAMIYLAFFSSGYAVVAWFQGISKIGASRTVICLYLTPVTASFTALIFLHEYFKFYHLIGFILVLAGVYLTILPKKV